MQNIHARVWVPLQNKCGLTDNGEPRYGFHMLRHAAASLFIKYLGWSPKRLQTVMGHASIMMTFDRYGHLFEDVTADREVHGEDRGSRQSSVIQFNGSTRRPSRAPVRWNGNTPSCWL
jgi:hypothetical protein